LDNDNKTTLKNIKRITFDSVGGQEGAIRTLKESVLAPLMYADAFKDDNFDRGVILHGPPGTGKTLLARALANETSAHFIHISANDLTTKWLGETEQHWREMFEEARAHQPAIIFVDEFDAITQNRDGGGTEIYNTTVNQILTLMSSLEADNARVVVVAATNRLDAIDPAMKRSGRFGSQVEVKAPDLKGCKDILQIHTKDRSIDPEFNYDEYAAKLHKAGATGADIAKIAAEAKKTMFRREGIYEKMFNKTFEEYDLYGKFITKEDFDKAYDETFKNNKPKKPIGFTS
jgi:transitional endoplasmic reticulum ATPase